MRKERQGKKEERKGKQNRERDETRHKTKEK